MGRIAEIMTDIFVGDRVTVIKSPYFSVKPGSVSVVTEVRQNHFGKGKHLYVLGEFPNRAFRRYEIRKAKK